MKEILSGICPCSSVSLILPCLVPNGKAAVMNANDLGRVYFIKRFSTMIQKIHVIETTFELLKNAGLFQHADESSGLLPLEKSDALEERFLSKQLDNLNLGKRTEYTEWNNDNGSDADLFLTDEELVEHETKNQKSHELLSVAVGKVCKEDNSDNGDDKDSFYEDCENSPNSFVPKLETEERSDKSMLCDISNENHDGNNKSNDYSMIEEVILEVVDTFFNTENENHDEKENNNISQCHTKSSEEDSSLDDEECEEEEYDEEDSDIFDEESDTDEESYSDPSWQADIENSDEDEDEDNGHSEEKMKKLKLLAQKNMSVVQNTSNLSVMESSTLSFFMSDNGPIQLQVGANLLTIDHLPFVYLNILPILSH